MTGLVTFMGWLVAILHQCLWELLRDLRHDLGLAKIVVPVC
jgi:hypothetical protein